MALLEVLVHPDPRLRAVALPVTRFDDELGSLIEVVNRFGSYFYGSILGVFVLAIASKRANGHGAFIGLIGGMLSVWVVATQTRVEFLWLNLVGAVAVYVVGIVVSALTGGNPRASETA